MSTERFKSQSVIPIEAVMELGATGVAFVRRKSNDEYWTDSVPVFDTPRVSVPMTLVTTTTDRTFWKLDFNTSVGDDIDNYVIECRNTAVSATQQPEVLFAYVGGYLNTIEEALVRLLGLTFENVAITDLLYDSNKNPLSSKIRNYDSASNALAAGATGLLETYLTTATFDVDSKMLTFNQIRVGS